MRKNETKEKNYAYKTTGYINTRGKRSFLR